MRYPCVAWRISRHLAFFVRGTLLLSRVENVNDEENKYYRSGHDMLELVHFEFNSLDKHTFVAASKAKVDPAFEGEDVGRGLFAEYFMSKGKVFYTVMETGEDCKIVKNGGTWHFDLGANQALAPEGDKRHIFMMNHAPKKSRGNNVKVEVDFREFDTPVSDSTIFVMRVEVTKNINALQEMCYDYFGTLPVPRYPFIQDHTPRVNVRKKVSLEKIAVTAADRTRVAEYTKLAKTLLKPGTPPYCYFHDTLPLSSSFLGRQQQWSDRHHSLLCKDVHQVFINGAFICGDIVHRACSHMRHVAGAASRVYIVNTNFLPGLLYETIGVSAIEPQQDRIDAYISQYPESNWATKLDEGKVVFIPMNYPLREHWCCVILWKDETGPYVRVYNSLQSYSRHDRTVANACAHACACMDPGKYGKIKWKFFRPHDILEQRSQNMRCALHVVARAWQVCNGEHLNRVLDRKSFDHITAYLQIQFLEDSPTVCGEGIIPKERLV